MNKFKKLCVVCGGTGGHFYPGVGIAQTFKQAAHDNDVILLLSGKHVVKQSEYAATLDICSEIIPAAQRPSNPLAILAFSKSIITGIMKAKHALKSFKPDVLLAMGSFASVPSILAALWLKIPVFLHDGNALLGKANLLFSRFAEHLGAGFPPVNADKLHCKWSWIGMPVRRELLQNQLNRQDAIKELNANHNLHFSTNTPTILVFGGSQGAQVFNENFPMALNSIPDNSIQLIHLTGQGKYAAVKKAYESINQRSLVLESSSSMALMYQASDFVISRSGGSTVAELAIFGKYACLVPYPYAADLHQDDNARFYESSGAGIMINNSNFTIKTITDLLTKWLRDPNDYIKSGLQAKTQAKPNAANDMLKLIETHI